MGTTELLEKIYTDARAKVAAIQEDKKRKLAEIAQRTQMAIDRLKRESTERLEERVRAIHDRVRSQAQLEGRKVILEAKWQVIDTVLEKAKKAILSSPDYPKIIEMLVKKYAPDQASVHLSAEDSKRWDKIAGIKTGEPVPITGGVIIRSAAAGRFTGKEEIDLSLDTIVSQLREELSTELAAILFTPEEKKHEPKG